MRLLKNLIIIISKRGIKFLFSSIYYFLKVTLYKFFGHKVIKKKIYNFKMNLDIFDKGISRTLLLFGERELEHKYILENCLKENMTVLDIGSNIGYYPLIELNKIKNTGKLISVEPSPENYEMLKKNLILNNFLNSETNIKTYNIAISEKSEIKKFYISNYSNLNSFHLEKDNKYLNEASFINVKTKSILDISEGKKIDFIRMDVEGHEVKILNSLVEYIKKTNYKPMVLFEPHLKRYNKNNDIVNALNNIFLLGYKTSIIGSSSHHGSKIISKLGYESKLKFNTDENVRKIFKNINNEHAIQIISELGGARSVLLT